MTVSHQPSQAHGSRPSKPEWTARILIALCASALLSGSDRIKAQDSASSQNCTYAKGVYHCNVESLKSVVAAAQTFAINTGPRDRIGANQLQTYGASLGKSLALANQPADLTFVLSATETGGVNYGPMDRELATLKIYASGGKDLIWVETLSGQPDLPWAAVVRRLLEQLRGRILNH